MCIRYTPIYHDAHCQRFHRDNWYDYCAQRDQPGGCTITSKDIKLFVCKNCGKAYQYVRHLEWEEEVNEIDEFDEWLAECAERKREKEERERKERRSVRGIARRVSSAVKGIGAVGKEGKEGKEGKKEK